MSCSENLGKYNLLQGVVLGYELLLRGRRLSSASFKLQH